ncbi:hypothetical protein PDG61_15630 [Mycolicibacterium sp. BiH015]|uniref:hypothetical protein n=1 Tax=Mycolicibacterium sp. BiH015 TaxID=3018808 RepID=UPI0022E8CA54|nr:hypothetical protein [Mycolicibacterium sp. BiH015]MDA2892350.1 hypothetical protein [Mycolicibacterium sp. BiH015]
MLQRTIPTGRTLIPGSLTFNAAQNSIWATTAGGRVVVVRLYDQKTVSVGAGYADPVGVVALPDGFRIAVAERDGCIYVARRESADRSTARALVDLSGSIRALRADVQTDSILALVDDGTGPALLRIAIDTGAVTTAAGGLDDATTFDVDTAARTATVMSVRADDTGALTTVGLDDGTTTVEEVGPYRHLATAPASAGGGLLLSRPDPTRPGNDVLVHWDGAENAVEPLSGECEGLTRWGSLVLAAVGDDIIAVEWGLEPGDLPMHAPLGPLYTGGYTRVICDVPILGLGVGDVEYLVQEGVDGGSVSVGQEAPDPRGTESVMLLAGVRTGEFHLDAVRKSDGKWLGTLRYRVTVIWPDDVLGPPVALTGTRNNMLMNWCGTGGIAGYTKPTPNLWRVLVVLVNLEDRGWDGTEVGARTEWKDRVIGGGESLRTYYEEVSAYRDGTHGMTVDLVGDQVFGPVQVPAGWGEVFKQKTPGDVNAGWKSKSKGYGVLAGAISDFFADLAGGATFMQLADSIVIVVRSGADKPDDMGPGQPQSPTRYVWGHAKKEVDFYRKTPTTYTQFSRPVTVMTDVYPVGAPQQNRTYTLCHEIGHNLGLDDLYDNDGDFPEEINERDAGAVDLMSSSQSLPHFSIANRVALGWAKRSWLRRFDFSADPHGDSVVLQATETLTEAGPPPGRFAGIEVPIGDDWSYLFEYRREQAGQIADQRMETTVVTGHNQIVVGTDLRVRGGEVARPPIIRLGNDVDGDGPLLVFNGTDYRDNDVTNPARMHDFVLRLTGIASPDADAAEVEVEYVEARRPQLLVRPAPGRGDFKSPDIRLMGPVGPTMPAVVKNATNQIEVTVHNVGVLDAVKTQIHVRWLPFTLTGAGAWNNLPDPAPFAVSARGTTKITVPWALPQSVKVGDVEAEHFCVRVDIDHYSDPAHPDLGEIVVADNWAQSNFDTKRVGFGSPSDRVATVATATNGLERTATYLFAADQTSPWYRVFVGHAWMELQPGQTRAVELAYESLAGDPVHGEEFDKNIERITGVDNQVAIVSAVLPEGTECDTPRDVFGVGLKLRAGRRVVIDGVERDQEVVRARVRQVGANGSSAVGSGELHLVAWPDDEPSRVSRTRGRIRNGVGAAPISAETHQDLADGRPTSFLLARAGDNVYAAALTEVSPMK